MLLYHAGAYFNKLFSYSFNHRTGDLPTQPHPTASRCLFIESLEIVWPGEHWKSICLLKWQGHNKRVPGSQAIIISLNGRAHAIFNPLTTFPSVTTLKPTGESGSWSLMRLPSTPSHCWVGSPCHKKRAHLPSCPSGGRGTSKPEAAARCQINASQDTCLWSRNPYSKA